MCFRPPQAQKPTKCPQCGAMNPPTKKNCGKCQADLMAIKMNPANWFEIPVDDLLRAKKFYETVFSYALSVNQIGSLNMAWFPAQPGTAGSSGSLVKAEGYSPSAAGAVVYLSVKDIPGTLAKVEANGGKILTQQTAMGDLGFIAHFEDCEGNRIGLYAQK